MSIAYRHPDGPCPRRHFAGGDGEWAARCQLLLLPDQEDGHRPWAGDKDQVQRTIQRELGLAELPDPPDVADALAVGACHYYQQHWPIGG